MGDHRASIKIEWSMHGHTQKADMWWNYYPCDDCYGFRVDRRLLEWLTEQYDTSMSKWDDMQEEYAVEQARKRREATSEAERKIEDLRKEADALEAKLRGGEAQA